MSVGPFLWFLNSDFGTTIMRHFKIRGRRHGIFSNLHSPAKYIQLVGTASMDKRSDITWVAHSPNVTTFSHRKAGKYKKTTKTAMVSIGTI